MKKKMLTVVIVIIAVIVLVFVGWYVMFVHFGRGPAFPFLQTKVVEFELAPGDISKTEPLMALTESEEEAKAIAEQYGITFVSFQSGVATYYTDEDPWQVIDRGVENGYQALYLNQSRQLYDS
ncbi:MAG: hypothetical protein HDR13_13090 [Lachnospiraceae bacterium]|nr:hypothetical protein [Lachnospiraceae bacterium]